MTVAIEDSTTNAATVIGNSDTVNTIVKSGGGNDFIFYPFYGRASASTPQNTVTAATFGGTNFVQDAYDFFNNVGTQDLYIGDFYILDTNIPATANPAFSFTNSQTLAISNLGAWFHLSGVDQTAPLRAHHANATETIIDSASARQYTGETGDIVIYTVSLNTPNGGMNIPSGFTQLMSTTAGDHGDTLLDVFAVYYKILTADETDATIDLPMNSTGTFRGWHWARVVKAAPGSSVSLVVQDSSQEQIADVVNLTQHHLLTVNDAQQEQIVDNTILVQEHQLIAASASQEQVSDVVSLIQHHQLIVQDSSQEQIVDVATVSIPSATSVTPDDTSQEQFADVVNLIQHSVLTPDGAIQIQATDNADLTVDILVDNTVQEQFTDITSLITLTVIDPASSVQEQFADQVTFSGLVVGYYQGDLSVFSMYQGTLRVTNVYTGDTTVFSAFDGDSSIN